VKSFFLILTTILISLCVSLLLIEIGIRLFFPVTDHPYTSYDPDVGVHLRPGQQGTMTLGAFGEFRGDYRINNAGWNSIHDYRHDKPDGTLRVAVIGDSFIEALGVDLEEGLHVVLEQRLNSSDACSGFERVEIYPFGYSGIPMSQYVSIMRHVSERYSPDAFIVHIFPVNDFEPSLTLSADGGGSHVLTYRPDDRNSFTEVPHVPFKPSPLKRFIGQFAAVRYLLFNLKITAVPWVQQLMTPADFYGDSTDKNPELLRRVTRFVFGEYKKHASNKPLLITADADRKGIYLNHGYKPEDLSDLDGVDPQYFNHIERAVAELDLDYLPLQPTLEEDFVRNRERFEFISHGRTLDGHWNARAHRLIGDALARWVAENVCGQAMSEQGMARASSP
jgi:hypothetical protein